MHYDWIYPRRHRLVYRQSSSFRWKRYYDFTARVGGVANPVWINESGRKNDIRGIDYDNTDGYWAYYGFGIYNAVSEPGDTIIYQSASYVRLTLKATSSTEEYEIRNLGAVHMHPNRARACIREAASAAIKDFIGNPDKHKPLYIKPPYVLETWFRRTGTAPPYKTTQRHPSDIVALHSASKETEIICRT